MNVRLPTLDEIREARNRLTDICRRLPLVPLHRDCSPRDVHLKLENLHPIGSYKLRGAGNVLLTTPAEVLSNGVITVSAGNLGQGVAWFARELEVTCTVLVPEHAPQAKLNGMKSLGARVEKISLDRWWNYMTTGAVPGFDGLFIHGVFDHRMMAGYGTMGLEILEDLPDLDTVVIPFGGGAMSCGVAVALQGINPAIRVVAAEVETGAPLKAALANGGPVEIEYRTSFVDGIGSKAVFPEMWPLLQQVVSDSEVVSLDQVRDAIRLLASRHHVIAEGAGAASVAAALGMTADPGKTVCIVSGGNIDMSEFCTIVT